QLDLPQYPRQPGVEDDWTTTLALKFLFKYHPRLMMINLPEVDTTGHAAGTNAAVMGPLMVSVDREIGRLIAAYGRAGMLSQTTFLITSDHAMIPGVHLIVQNRIDQIIRKSGGDPLYVGHGDYCPIWLRNLNAVPRVAVGLANANIPNVAAVYAKTGTGAYNLISSPARLADQGVNQSYADLLASFNSAESPDIVLLYDENTFTMTPALQQQGRKGDHGGATWGAQHIPLVIEGPGVKQAYVSNYPARLVDIAPTIETLLGITPPRSQDGVPLADAMLRPPSWAVAAQAAAVSRAALDVGGLEREAAARPNIAR
ncbi:MAG: alkaline phosphatase family protein, partial [Chloroflexi bacterium]|nr:alkaline phosphatase family protein [Chloroflexota bacterium]